MSIFLIGSRSSIGQALVHYFNKDNVEYICYRTRFLGSQHITNPREIVVDAYDHINFKDISMNDIVVYASGLGSVYISEKNTQASYRKNYSMPVYLAKEAHKKGAYFIYLSSAAVYGEPIGNSITEYSVCRPLSIYGKHKLMAEKAINRVDKTVILRLFSTYSCFQEKLFVHDFLDKLITAERNGQSFVRCRGVEDAARDFLHHYGLYEAIKKIMEEPSLFTGIQLVGSGKSMTIRKAAELIVAELNKGHIEIIFEDKQDRLTPVSWFISEGSYSSVCEKLHEYTIPFGIKQMYQERLSSYV